MDKNRNFHEKYLSRLKRERRLITVSRIFLFLFFFASWEFSARAGLINDFIMSSPSRILKLLVSMISDGSIMTHTMVTLEETVLSFLIVMVLGILGAVLLWSSRRLAAILDPFLVILNSLPKSALAPILIVWLGSSMKTIITAAVSVGVFGAILTLCRSFLEADPEQIRLMESLGGTRKDVMTRILLPSSLPLLVSMMKVQIGLCLVGVIIGEFLAADRGLGYLIIYGSQVFQMDLVILSIFILLVMSACFYQLITLAERKLLSGKNQN